MLLFIAFVFILQMTLTEWFTDFSTLIAFVPTVAAFIFTQLAKINFVLNDTWKKVITMVIAIAVTFIANWFGWGIFVAVIWWKLLIYGVLAGLVSMGIFQLGWAQLILQLLGMAQSKDKFNTLNNVKSRFE